MIRNFVSIFVVFVLLIVGTACRTDDEIDYLAVIDSKDYVMQVEVLPLLLVEDKFNELFPPELYDSHDLDLVYDGILTRYLIALIETNKDNLLRESFIDIIRSYRYWRSVFDFIDLFMPYNDYMEKLEIIIPEMIRAYREIDEERIHVKLMWGMLLWSPLMLYDESEADRLDVETDVLAGEMIIVFNYERQIWEDEITINDVPEKYRYSVERMIVARQEDGSFDMGIDLW
ncbi:MAG: hypothetical protein LBC71_03300 [Oscillospiraceae bacterium]|nr:hypothetical protein [Oscillospiraceae bacterium]